jgi:hypothetical protein
MTFWDVSTDRIFVGMLLAYALGPTAFCAAVLYWIMR